MRNKILDEVIDSVVDSSDQPLEFKAAFKSYIKNKFSGNGSDDDLKAALSLMEVPEDAEEMSV